MIIQSKEIMFWHGDFLELEPSITTGQANLVHEGETHASLSNNFMFMSTQAG